MVGGSTCDERHGGGGGAAAQPELVSALTERIVRENPEAVRATILGGDELYQVPPGGLHAGEDLLDRLDLAVVDGKVVDTRDMTDVEVE